MRPANPNGNGKKQLEPSLPHSAGSADLLRNAKLMEQVRQIIAETPEVRPEKVEPLLEALVAGTYEIDARELANILILMLILDP